MISAISFQANKQMTTLQKVIRQIKSMAFI